MYKAKYLQPQPRTGPDTVLHLKLYDGPNWSTAGSVLHVFDYSLNNHPGTLKGTVPTFQYPGVDLPGTDEYIEVADHADFTPALTPFSISAWVNLHDVSFMIASKGVYNTDGEWWFHTTAGDKLIFRVYDENVDNCYIGKAYNTALARDKWLYLVATYNGGNVSDGIKLYLNSVKVDDTPSELGVFVTCQDGGHAVWIGRYDVNYANGLINDVMIHKKELSAAEVLDIYNLTKWRYGR